MTRFIQESPRGQAPKPEKQEPIVKFGGKDGNKDYSSLYGGKKIPTKGGFK